MRAPLLSCTIPTIANGGPAKAAVNEPMKTRKEKKNASRFKPNLTD